MGLGQRFGRALTSRARLGARISALAARDALDCAPLLRAAGRARTLEAEDLHALHRYCFDDRYLELWKELATRFPLPQVLAHCAVLAREEEPAFALSLFTQAVRREAGLWFAFGDDAWIEAADDSDDGAAADLRIARLQAYVDIEPEPHGEEIRELYAELLDLCAADPSRMERVRRIGRRIDELVAGGFVPRAFLRRGSSRSD